MTDDAARELTSIQMPVRVRDRLWRLKSRKSYAVFLDELCDLYETRNPVLARMVREMEKAEASAKALREARPS